MDLQSFASFYDLLEEEIVSIIGDGKQLTMEIKMAMKIEYIANGYRPEFDEHYLHAFTFASPTIINEKAPIKISDVHFEEDRYVFLANNQKVILENQKVEVKNYVKHLNEL